MTRAAVFMKLRQQHRVGRRDWWAPKLAVFTRDMVLAKCLKGNASASATVKWGDDVIFVGH